MRLTTAQIVIVLGSLAGLFGTWIFIRSSKSGRQLEAVASDPFLARVIGIRVENTILLAIAISSLLAAVAGILVSYDIDMSPNMGMYPMMLGVVAVIIGGNTIWGTAWALYLLPLLSISLSLRDYPQNGKRRLLFYSLLYSWCLDHRVLVISYGRRLCDMSWFGQAFSSI